MRATFFIYLVGFFFAVGAYSQSAVTYPLTNGTGSVESLCFDTASKIIYTGGSFTTMGGIARQNLAAVDGVTGNVLSWAPVTNGVVTAIIQNGNTIYIGGAFTTVNGISRNSFAALDLSGNLLPWAPSFDNVVRCFYITGTTLYVGGDFTSIDGNARDLIASFDLSTNSLTGWNPPVPSVNYTSVEKVNVSNNNVLVLYSMPGFSELYIISSSTAAYLDNLLPDFPITDFYLQGNEIFVAGEFTNITTGSGTTFQDYLIVYDLSTANISSQSFNTPYYPTTISLFNDTVYTPDDAAINSSCDVFYKYTSSTAVPQSFLPSSVNFKKSFSSNSRLFFLQSNNSCANNPSTWQLGGLCLYPPAPVFASGDSTVCPGAQNVPFALATQTCHSSFFWSYSGSGVTINGAGNSVTLNFSQSATNGILSAYATTDCGYNTPVASFPITLLPPVIANAGANKNLTCDSTQVTLNAALTDPNLTFLWLLPDGTTTLTQLVYADTVGNYIMTATNSVTTCFNSDTVVVGIDTVKPVINTISGNFQLSCIVNSVVLDGSTTNGSDSTWWVHQGGGVFADPDTVSLAGTYLFNAKNNTNGCPDSSSIIVTSNTTPPVLTMPPMDSLLFALDIITCDTTSILLNAGVSANSILYWDLNASPQNDSLTNPLTVLASGQFTCFALDTTNGCSASGIIFTQVDTSKPALTLPFDSTFITCSYNSAILDASSITPSVNLNWTGPSSFTSADPATVNQNGWYVITATKNSNGCFRADSVFVGLDSTLDISCGNDTIICPGSSAMYSVSVVGGNAPFIYSWSDGSSAANAVFSPSDTTEYILVLTDQNNCVGRDTVIVFVPDAIDDSTLTYKPCDAGSPNGQITVYAYGGIAPYQYSIDNGGTFQSSSAITGLNYGNYLIIIRDTLGCIKTDSVSINQQSLSFQADFLVASNGFEDSVLVLVDVCDPRPDSVWWEIPVNATLTGPDSTGTQYYVDLPDTGSYPVIMHAQFGQCEDTDTAMVDLVQWDSTYASIANGLIDSLNVYPNPAPGGQFNVYVKLNKKQTFSVNIYNSTGTTPILTQSVFENDIFNNLIALPSPAPGTYVVRVVAEYDSRYIILVVP